MKLWKGNLVELTARAAKPELTAIERAGRCAPVKVRPLFTALCDNLFHPDLTLDMVREEAAIGDKAVWTEFRDAVGQPAWDYVRDARLAVAARLLLYTDLSVAEVGRTVGYDSVTTFRGLFHTFAGLRPTEYRRRARQLLKRAGPPPRKADDPEHWEQALRGDASNAEARELIDWVGAFHPSAPPSPFVEPHPWFSLQGEIADALADDLDKLPWPDQRRLVRDAVWFPSVAFYQALGARSREAADPERGAELALLAIDSLAANGYLEVLPGMAASAWARLARARWRAGDLAGAQKALEQSDKEFERVSEEEDLEPAEEAERSRVAAAFRWFRGRPEEALELADYAVKQHRAAPSEDLGKALLLRAELRAASGDAKGARVDVEEARGLPTAASDWQRRRLLDLWLHVLVLLGDKRELAAVLPAARRAAEELDDHGMVPRLRWFEGHASRDPEPLWRAAREGFAELGESVWVARTTLDLLAHCSSEERPAEASGPASELAGMLGALAESSESLAAVKALRAAVAAGALTPDVLDEVGSVLGRLEWDLRAREALRFAK